MTRQYGTVLICKAQYYASGALVGGELRQRADGARVRASESAERVKAAAAV